jgi:drug/metabolite transporter (DMT)-like permease
VQAELIGQDRRMFTLALQFKQQTTMNMEEIAGALTALAGVMMFLGSGVPFGRRGGQALGGLALAVAGVLWVLALRYGA